MSEERKEHESLDALVGQAMGDIVEEASLEAATAHDDGERSDHRHKRERIALMVLLPLLLVITMLNVSGNGLFAAAAPPPMTPAEATTSALQLLSDAADELTFFFEENGRYPQQPDFIGPDGPDGDDEPFVYDLVSSDHYILTATISGESMTYDSHDDAAAAFREVRR